MAKYRKKPVVIDAVRFQWGMEDGIKRWNEYCPKDANTPNGYADVHQEQYKNKGFNEKFPDNQWCPYIKTLEGDMIVGEGDWIITGIKGERCPCKPDIFEMTYELIN